MSGARVITQGPRFHWFGYYDKLQLDPSGRFALGMAVDFEHRSPQPDDEIEIGTVDLHDNNRWTKLGTSRAWGWQQGCMLQWLPGSESEVVWNDREDDRFVARMLDVRSGQQRTLPHPVYTLCPDGKHALSTDFRRINHMRPGYGYAGVPDPNHDVLAPTESGISVIDLQSGASEQILSVAAVAAVPYTHGDLAAAKHYFNHLLVNPTGERFIFLHRWRFDDGPFHTRMMTAALDGSDVRVIDDYGDMSHFIWRDESHILAWCRRPSHGRAFYLLRDCAEREAVEVAIVGAGKMTKNGHCTYLRVEADAASRTDDWVLNDTYASGDAERKQELYLYHTGSNRRIELGAYYSPEGYDGEWRCDLHPRASRDGGMILFDSAHGGDGRQMYLVETPKGVVRGV